MAIKTFTTGEILTASDTNTYLANSGLVFIKETTVSGTPSAIDVDNVFSSTYLNYRVIFDLSNGSSTEIRMGFFDTSGAIDTTANYASQRLNVDGATLVGQRTTGLTAGIVAYGDAPTATASLDIFKPNIATDRTFVQSHELTQTNTVRIEFVNMVYGVNKAFRGFRLTAPSSNFDGGKIIVYGYRNE